MRLPYFTAGIAVVFSVVAIPVAAVTSLGTGTSALIGADRTDPDDNIDDNAPGNPPYYGSEYEFIFASSSADAVFTPGAGYNEGGLDIFDNKVAGGETKFCCEGPTQNVTVRFASPFVLRTFTVAAGEDAPERDPDIWSIEGSNDGTTWTPIFSYSNNGTSPFTQRNEVLRYDAPGDFAVPAAYSWYRYVVTSVVDTGGAPLHQLGEVELFGNLAATADLTLTKTVATVASDSVTFEIDVTNEGPATATNVYVNDLLPEGLDFVSGTTPGSGCSEVMDGVVSCHVGTLADGQSATVTITAARTGSGFMTNTAHVVSDETDPTFGVGFAALTLTAPPEIPALDWRGMAMLALLLAAAAWIVLKQS